MQNQHSLFRKLPCAALIIFNLTVLNSKAQQATIPSDTIRPSTAVIPNRESKLDLSKDLKAQLLPLDSIIAIAQSYSPTVQAQDALISAGKQQVQLGKREWQNGIFASFTQSIGNQSLFYNTNQDPIATQSQSQTTGYRLALNFNIPLYWFSARNSRIRIYEDELRVRDKTKEKMKLDVAKEVITVYNNMLSAHKILLIASNTKSSSHILLDMAEKQFAQSDISIADYSGIIAISSKSDQDYEISKRDFYTWYEQLEALVGVPLDNLTKLK